MYEHTITMSNAEWGAVLAALDLFANQVENSNREFAEEDANYLRMLARFIRGSMDADNANRED